VFDPLRNLLIFRVAARACIQCDEEGEEKYPRASCHFWTM